MHHVDYQPLGRETRDDLRPLCRLCHQGVHILVEDGAASLSTAADDYTRMAHAFVSPYGPDPVRRFLPFRAFAEYVIRDRLDTAAKAYLELREPLSQRQPAN
jgi:hypothetical protein